MEFIPCLECGNKVKRDVFYRFCPACDAPYGVIAWRKAGDRYFARGQYKHAEKFYRTAMDVFMSILGPEHPEVGGVLKNLAEVCRVTDRVQEAGELEVRADRILSKADNRK